MGSVFMAFRLQPRQFQILRKLSQEPVATAIPSAVTPRQLTLLSWPERMPEGEREGSASSHADPGKRHACLCGCRSWCLGSQGWAG